MIKTYKNETDPEDKIIKCVCNVCAHEWIPYNNQPPICCAGCKTPYWNSEKKNKKKNN
jgi:hypothetical protein